MLSGGADKVEEARELGAELFVNTRERSAAETLQEWDGGADVVLAAVPNVDPITDTFPGLASDGTLVVLTMQ